MAMRSMVATASTGYCPAADSADSITASAPSKMAVATSDTSARVGTGLVIIDSSIWVATTTGLPAPRDARVICFCRPGTFSTGSSTPRSPRATIRASVISRIPARCSIAWGFSIFAITAARPRAIFLASAMSSGRWMKDSAIQSAPASRRGFEIGMVLAGQRGKSEHGIGQADALARRQLAADLDAGERPLRRHLDRDQPDLAVIEQQRMAGLERGEDFRMRQVHPRRRRPGRDRHRGRNRRPWRGERRPP